MLLSGGDDNHSKRLAYQTSKGGISDYTHRYIVEYPQNSQEQLKSELNVKFPEVNDSHQASSMLCKAITTSGLFY